MKPFDPPWVVPLSNPGEHERFLSDPEEQAAAGAVELRLDLWAPRPDLTPAIEAIPCPVIVTWREGGAEEADRRETLNAALQGRYGECWIDLDVEDPLVRESLPSRTNPLILSAHLNRTLTDPELAALLDMLEARGAEATKIVLWPDGLSSVQQALRFADRPAGKPRMLCAGGTVGSPTRILGLSRGSAWSYGRMCGSAGTDPGQPPAALVASRYPGAGSPRRVFAILGSDVRRSISPGFHNRLLRSHGVDDTLWVNLSLEEPPSLREIGDEFPLVGLAITTPHKDWARQVATPGDAEAATYSAWNTLVRDEGGEWHGFNTDGPAIAELLRSAGLDDGASVVILGGGGAATGTAAALQHSGYAVQLVVRRAEARVKLETEGFDVAGEEAIASAAALLNATGAGRGADDPLPWDLSAFSGGLALEMAYEPRRTAFLETLAATGARTIEGYRMFAGQARRQARIFYGLDVDDEEADALTRAALEELSRDLPAQGL